MGLPLTEADFELFAAQPLAKPKREPIHEIKPLPKASRETQNARAHKVWVQSLVAYAVTGIVALCLFMVVQSEAGYHQALVDQRALMATLEQAQQRSIGCQTQIERKFSLDIIQEYAQNELHMTPIEGGRVTYVNVTRGDQWID